MSTSLTQSRIDCWEDTQKLCETLPQPPLSTKFYYNPTFPYKKRYTQSNIQFFDRDAIDLGLAIQATGNKPLVLNLSDDRVPGGCVYSGSGAQEESLFRRTNYFQTLTYDYYPIRFGQAVYSPNVTIIKTSERTGWQPHNEAGNKLCFVACPAIKYPQITVDRREGKRLSAQDVQNLKVQIMTIIQTAVQNGHDTIVFGAMGCGAWCNPSKHVAEVFRDVLREMDGVIPHYCFAILTTRGDLAVFNGVEEQITTVDIFKRVFQQIS